MDRNLRKITITIDDVVALRKESVDRNTAVDNLTQGVFKSLSARRAWIEILSPAGCWRDARRRSPQGERG